MKTTIGFRFTSIVADTDNGYCKIILNDCGKIVKAYAGPSSTEKCEIYCASTPDSCWKNSMNEMLSLSPSCFIELFKELKCKEQISYAKEIATNQATLLTCQADIMLDYAAQLHSLTQTK